MKIRQSLSQARLCFKAGVRLGLLCRHRNERDGCRVACQTASLLQVCALEVPFTYGAKACTELLLISFALADHMYRMATMALIADEPGVDMHRYAQLLDTRFYLMSIQPNMHQI